MLTWKQCKKMVLAGAERAYWLALHDAYGGNVSAIGRSAGVERANARRFLRRLGVRSPLAPEPPAAVRARSVRGAKK